MARKRTQQVGSSWDGAVRDTSLSAMMEQLRQGAQQKLGKAVSIGELTTVGLPLPALCLRYLFQSTVFPLSRIYQLTGEEGSCKSAFLWEILRWHLLFGGGACFAENENKDAPQLRNSVFHWRQDWIDRVLVQGTNSLEEWQNYFTTTTEQMRMMLDAPGGPGRTVPMCFCVDSLMGTTTQDLINKTKEDGHATRGYAVEANLISRYMRTMPERLQGYPFTMVGTNHLKPGTDARGLPTSSIPGGKSVKFMESMELELKKVAQPDIELLEYGGIRIRFVARKNSLGPSRKSITADFLWWFRPGPDGKPQQLSVWDWNTATIDMIRAFDITPGKKTIYNAIRDITGITIENAGRKLAYSDVLGVPKSAAEHFRMIGARLEARPDLMAQLHTLLGITCYQEFTPAVDYRIQQQEAEQAAAAAAAAARAAAGVAPAAPVAVTQENQMAQVVDDPDTDTPQESGEMDLDFDALDAMTDT